MVDDMLPTESNYHYLFDVLTKNQSIPHTPTGLIWGHSPARRNREGERGDPGAAGQLSAPGRDTAQQEGLQRPAPRRPQREQLVSGHGRMCVVNVLMNKTTVNHPYP